MARGTIDTYEIGDASITVEFDTGGPVGATEVVFINGDDYSVTRWFYYDEFHEQYARNFAEKIVTDSEYRQKSLDGTADWAQVSDLYDEASRRVHQLFRDHKLLGYRHGNDTEKQRYETATTEQERICKSLFEEIKSRIRDGENVASLSNYIDDRVETAKQIATTLDPEAAHTLEVGMRVLDTGDTTTFRPEDTASVAVVVALPPDSADAHYVTDTDTVADYNENYPDDASVATVAFESDLPEADEWDDDPERLQEIASGDAIRTYTYPAPRLVPVDVAERLKDPP
ncbi:hypothetical protein SAMN05216388_102638 [Halorientalis persicus]|uniref:Uncharacterized protein n=1 Tax=Halorientalis persicus TaxID=1367881 RepID=A0A1H8U9V1_9EURY|nr:hypothetical protein [Halorientalis persicus]SEO99866.1 hypothetical protein SAMN05216388_102638 [Halorientalis persicus]